MSSKMVFTTAFLKLSDILLLLFLSEPGLLLKHPRFLELWSAGATLVVVCEVASLAVVFNSCGTRV